MKTQISEALILDTARDTVKAFKKLWKSIDEFHLNEAIRAVIEKHLQTIPLYR